MSDKKQILCCEQEIDVSIWLDENDLARIDDPEKMKTDLKQIVNVVEIFDNVDECVDSITDSQDHQVLLIVSESAAEDIVPALHAVKQLKAIYIFSSNRSTNAFWMKKYDKIMGIISSIASIYRVLEAYEKDGSVEFSFLSNLPTSLTDVDPKNQQDVMFMYGQLLKYVLTKMSYSESDRSQMFDFLRSKYQNPKDIEKILEFQCRYDQVDPIQWYTKDWFLYSDLNKALREYDVTYLYAVRVFIKDLHEQIVQCHMKSTESTILKLYRGMNIATAIFDGMKMKSDRLLSFNCFLSTTANNEVAMMYSGALGSLPHMTSVMFEIDIDHSIFTPAYYVEIKDKGQFEDEKEFLFTMGSVFRIRSIEPPDDRNISRIKLLLTDDNDVELTQLTNSMLSDMGIVNELSFIRLMTLWGKYEEAKKIGQLVLPTVSQELKPILSILLAGIDFEQGQREDAIAQLQSVYDFSDERSPISVNNTIAGLGKVALCWAQGKWDLAVENIETLYGIKTSEVSKYQPESLGTGYLMIGSIRFQQGHLSDALSYTTKAYETLKSSVPSTHPHLASCLQIIAAIKGINGINGQSDQISIILKETVKIRERSLPPEHPHRRITEWVTEFFNFPRSDNYQSESQYEFSQIVTGIQPVVENNQNSLLLKGGVYFVENKIDDALSNINKYLETIQGKPFITSQIEWYKAHMMKAACHRKREELAEAIESYNKASESLMESIDQSYPCVAQVLQEIATIYAGQNMFDEAFAVWERCRDRATDISREDVNAFNNTRLQSIANTYKKQGFYYEDFEQYEDALVSFEKCLETQTTSLPIDHVNIQHTHWLIGLNYLRQEKYDNALASFQDSLNIIKSYHPTRTNDLVRAYKDVAKSFQLLGKFSDALAHFEAALQIQLESLSPTDGSIAHTQNRLGFLHCQMGNPDQASIQYTKCLEMDLTEWPFSLVEIADGYFFIGYLYEEQQQNEKALSHFQQSLTVRKKCSPINPLHFATAYTHIGIVCFNLRRFSNALENFQLAMDLQLQVISSTDPSIANIWIRIAMVHIELNDYEQALFALTSRFKIEHSDMPLSEVEESSRSFIQGYLFSNYQQSAALTKWEQVLDFEARLLPADHPNLIHTYRRNGCKLSAEKKHSDALCNFQRALQIRLKSSPETDLALAKDYWYLGIEYGFLQQFDEALSNLQMCLSIQTSFLPSYHLDLADTYHMIGHILQQQQKLTEALEYYDSALKSFNRPLSSTNLGASKDDIEHCKCSLANTYGNIGTTHTKLSNFPCALQNFQNALDFRLECASSTSQQIAKNMDHLINTYVAMNNYERALFICRKQYEVMHPTISSFLFNVDSFSHSIIRKKYFSLYSLNDNLEHFQRFLEFQMNSLSSDHPHLAPTYARIGDLLKKENKFSEALNSYRHGLSILQRYLSSTNLAFLEASNIFVNIHLAYVYESIFNLLYKQGDLCGALENLQHTLKIRLQYLPTTDLAIAKLHSMLGYLQIDLKQNEEALSNFERALVIQAVSLPPDHLDLAKTHMMIGEILLQQQKLKEALESHECALTILFQSFASANLAKDEASIKSRNSSLVDVYTLIGDVHSETGNFSEACHNYQLALDIQLECTSTMHPKAQQIIKKVGYVHRLLV